MKHPDDWHEEEEENFNLALSQRTEELYRVPNLEADEQGIIEALVLPLRDLVVFPRMVSPIFVGREASLLAVQEAQHRNQTVIGLTQRDAELEEPGPKDFLPIGVEMAVGRLLSMPDGSSSALVQGRRRVRDPGVHPPQAVYQGAGTRPFRIIHCRSPDPGDHALRAGPLRSLRPTGPFHPGGGAPLRHEHLRAGLAGGYDRLLALAQL